MNTESSTCRAVYAVVHDGVSDSGHQLYTIHEDRVPNADNWKLFVSQATEHLKAAADSQVVPLPVIASGGLMGKDYANGWNDCRDEILSNLSDAVNASPAVATAGDGVTERVEAGIAAAARYTKDNGYEHFTTGAIDAAVREALASPSAPRVGVPEGLLDRVRSAEQRIADGHSIRRVPADPSDPDLVLAEVRMFLEGNAEPFWITPAPEVQS